jgi:hypothetical protein
MPEHPLPDWLDRRTAEWCAALCDGIAARLLQTWPAAHERRLGVEIAAGAIRAMLASGEKPALPAVVLPFRMPGGG